ncbi:MAG: hypothetical protein ACREDV_01755 [Methylocella sp.]
MKLLRIAAVAALTTFGGIFASAGNAALAAGLFTGAPAARTLATPAPGHSFETAHYRKHYRHRRHRWHRRHYWHPYYRHYYRPYYWRPYYQRHYYYYGQPYYWY